MLHLLQLNSSIVLNLSRWLGIGNMADNVEPLRKLIADEMNTSLPDEQGSFLDRYLAEIKRAQPGSSFYKEDGKKHAVGSVMDIFFAGMHDLMIVSPIIPFTCTFDQAWTPHLHSSNGSFITW